MNKNRLLLQLYYWACEYDIPDQEIQEFVSDLGFDMSDMNNMPMNKAYQQPINADTFKQELLAS